MVKPKSVYLDQAATSWPKPPEVFEAMQSAMHDAGGNPGRSGHGMSLAAARILFDTRESVASLLGVADSSHVVFTANATHALNIAIKGLLKPGDHVITSSTEHNAVMRPLRDIAGISIDFIAAGSDGAPDLSSLQALTRANTRMVVAAHGSNVTGHVFPVRETGAFCRSRGIAFLVDAAQTAGSVAIDMNADNIDYLAFTGHKSLLGPTGTGGLCINSPLVPRPLYCGGTGSRSEFEQQPSFLPDCLEAGTPNTVGLAGLNAAIAYLQRVTIDTIAQHEQRLREKLVRGLKDLPGVRLFSGQLPIVSLTIDGIRPDSIALRLERDFGLLTRVGLHCAPAAHRAIATAPAGTVRLSFGYLNTDEDIETAIHAIETIASE